MTQQEIEFVKDDIQEMKEMLNTFEEEVLKYSYLAAHSYIKPVKNVIFNATSEMLNIRNFRINPIDGIINTDLEFLTD